MLDKQTKESIGRCLQGRPFLIPIFTSTLDIPERLHEYNRDLFIVYNGKQFEIHSLATPQSYQATLPYKKLDERTLRYVRKNDLRVHGKKIFEQIEQEEQRVEKAKQRQFHNDVEAVAKDTRRSFAKAAWDDGGELFFGRP